MLRRGVTELTRCTCRAVQHRAAQQYSASTSGAAPHCYRFASAFSTAPESLPDSSKSFKASLFNAHPQSLASDRLTEEPFPGTEKNFFTRLLLRVGGYYSRDSQLIRGAKYLYYDIVEQSTTPALYEAFGLEQRFATTYSLLCLHVWMALVRLRAEGKEGKYLAQMLYENFQDDVEVRVRAEGVKVRISKWLSELEKMFYGSSMAYDKALKGDGSLADALLRNVYGNDSAKRKQAEMMARYVKRELACLSMTESEAVMSGKVKFTDLVF